MKKLDETAFTERELKIFKEIQEYAKKYQTKKVVLFGSRARRTNREKSDIDMAVLMLQSFILILMRRSIRY